MLDYQVNGLSVFTKTKRRSNAFTRRCRDVFVWQLEDKLHFKKCTSLNTRRCVALFFFCLRFRSDTFKLNIPQLFFSYALVGNDGNKQTFIAPVCFSLALLLWHGLTPVAGKATVMWGGLCALISVLGDYLFFWATDSLFVSCFCDHELLQNVLIVPCVGKISWLFLSFPALMNRQCEGRLFSKHGTFPSYGADRQSWIRLFFKKTLAVLFHTAMQVWSKPLHACLLSGMQLYRMGTKNIFFILIEL